MPRLLISAVLVLVSAAFVALGAGSAFAERRIALVIGNSSYKNPDLTLLNPKNDAEDMAAVLKDLGFEVVLSIDASTRDMDAALRRFSTMAPSADSVLFYYAGHAMQFQGRNYLMPVDGELELESDLRRNMVSDEDIRAALDRASGAKIMILDACRNNPLASRFMRSMTGASRGLTSSTRGLARIDKTQGMFIAYATAAVALDGNNSRNSPFTASLIRRMNEPGLTIEAMFSRVRRDVFETTGGRQRPETFNSLLDDYYLNQSDRLLWEKLRDSADVAALENFIRQYPYSIHRFDALHRLDILQRNARERDEVARKKLLEDERQLAEQAEREKAAEQERLARLEADNRRKAEETAAAAERARQQQERARLEAERQKAEQAAAAERDRLEAERQKAEQAAIAERARAEAERKKAEAVAAEQARQQAAELARQEQERAQLEAAHKKAEAAAEQARKQQEAARLEDDRKKAEEATRLARLEQDRIRAEQDRARLEAERQQKLRDDEARRQADVQRQAAERLARLEEERIKTEEARRREEEKQQACQIERTRLEALSAGADIGQLQNFVKQSACEDVRRLANDLLARRQQEAKICATETAQFKGLQARSGRPGGAEKLIEFEQGMGCDSLRPTVAAAMGKLKVQVAQQELKRLGCYAGPANGEISSGTLDGLKRYLAKLDRPETEAAINDDLLANLRSQPDHLCPMECPAGKTPSGGTCIADLPEQRPARPERDRPERQERQERERPSRPVVHAPAPRREVEREAPRRAERPVATPRAERPSAPAGRPSGGGELTTGM